jgi:hypothetical protein
MTHDQDQPSEPQTQAIEAQTDEEWAAAIEKDMEERYGEIVQKAHWVDVGEPGW